MGKRAGFFIGNRSILDVQLVILNIFAYSYHDSVLLCVAGRPCPWTPQRVDSQFVFPSLLPTRGLFDRKFSLFEY